MCSTVTNTTNNSDWPLGSGCSGDADLIEDLMSTVRAEIGNAGFAAVVGMPELAIDALDIARLKIADVRDLLANHDH